jgi:2-polyprenyl-3-methyl-5-hydroxy-6-metoxy-1,4-benzoquinol methylase
MVSNVEDNKRINKNHWDKLLKGENLEAIKRKVEHHEAFLADATRTDAGWVGMYYGGFQHKIKGSRILELGCGRGLNALIMAKLGAEVVAVDVAEESPKIIDHLSQELGLSDRVTAFAGDFRLFSFALQSFDFIIGQAFLHHLVHELEDEILYKCSILLKPHGEARFMESAENSKLLDQIRWLVPVPNRPSILQKRRFAQWKENDSHPIRDNSSQHFTQIGKKYFKDVEVIPYGGIDRFYRLFPRTELTRAFRRWAFRFEKKLPKVINMKIARAQTIIYKTPKNTGVGRAISNQDG